MRRIRLAAYPKWTNELRSFLEEVLSRPDVWMITMRGVIEWMKYPAPVDRMEAWFDAGCYRGACAIGQHAAVDAPIPQPELSAPYPNPFGAETRMTMSLSQSSHVRLELFDLLGRRVAAVADARFAPGSHEFTVDGRTFPPGAYVAVLEVNARLVTAAD